ncbi:MAG: metal-dependent hydrolase [Nanoarchaeota archaeon]|nr:metal-dependent hydrolase [Nanoarchaeota archaeon]MBU1623293.1 metal-dependent hydrolase [Nanoarchaeota archaeon]MBU1974071.1 metal-dependent hydrolase [Nanoarchaeota archaeon]
MYPQTHFLFPFFISAILVKLNVLSWKLALASGIVGVLIDADHYVEHIIRAKTNKWSLKATWNNSAKLHRFYQRSFIHHREGFLVLTLLFIIVLFFSWQIALAKAIGYYSHLLLDYVHLKKKKYLQFKIGKFFVKESWFELGFDFFLVVGIVIIVLV